jgi:hypothetical protein
MSLSRHRRLAVWLLLAGILAAAPAWAIVYSTYDTRSQFNAALGVGPGTITIPASNIIDFNNLSSFSQHVPINSDVDWSGSDYLTVGVAGDLGATDNTKLLYLNNSGGSVVANFLTTTITAFAFDLFTTGPVGKDVTVSVFLQGDGSTPTYTQTVHTTTGGFFGFSSSVPIVKITLTTPLYTGGAPAVDNFDYGTYTAPADLSGVPESSSLLYVALGIACVALGRYRRFRRPPQPAQT